MNRIITNKQNNENVSTNNGQELETKEISSTLDNKNLWKVKKKEEANVALQLANKIERTSVQ